MNDGKRKSGPALCNTSGLHKTRGPRYNLFFILLMPLQFYIYCFNHLGPSVTQLKCTYKKLDNEKSCSTTTTTSLKNWQVCGEEGGREWRRRRGGGSGGGGGEVLTSIGISWLFSPWGTTKGNFEKDFFRSPVAPNTALFTRLQQQREQKLSPQCRQYCYKKTQQ